MLNRPSLLTLEGRTDLVGCEVGVSEGINAHGILTELDIKKLYLVDCYTIFSVKTPGCEILQSEVDRDKAKAYERLAPWESKITWLEKMSWDVTDEDIPPGSLDFVYIDGGHSYDVVSDDLKLFYGKVKIGGMIAGHDFGNPGTGVREAVFDFCDMYGITHLQTGEDTDWWIIKLEEIVHGRI